VPSVLVVTAIASVVAAGVRTAVVIVVPGSVGSVG
jgi:hypothetical protein